MTLRIEEEFVDTKGVIRIRKSNLVNVIDA